MLNQLLPAPINVVAGQTATLKVPNFALTLQKLQFELGGTFTKAQITGIRVKIGATQVYNLTGAQLDTINKDKGIFDAAAFLTVDFTERDSHSLSGKEVGGYDILNLPGDIYVELDISSGAANPTLSCRGFFTPLQGNSVILKMKKIPFATNVAGEMVIPLDSIKGTAVKRIWFFYAGSDGNINKVLFKKDGTTIHELTDAENDFMRQEFRKVPQSGTYCLDFIADNNPNSMLQTVDTSGQTPRPNALEMRIYLTAADHGEIVFELLDLPGNA